MIKTHQEARFENDEYAKTGWKIRRIMFADKGFRRYYDEQFGFDLLGRQGT